MSPRPTSRPRLLAATLSATVLGACGGGGDGFVTTPPTPTPVTVSVTPPQASVSAGGSVSFAVSISGGSPTPTLQSCTSSATAVATVAVSGTSCTATGVAPGTSTITATTSAGQTAAAVLTVQALTPAISAFTLTPPNPSVVIGETTPLSANVTSPTGATVNVSYATSNSAVAVVSAAGVITGVTVGSAVITATAQGSGTGFAAVSVQRTANVTVTADPCAATTLTLPFSGTGTVTSNSCLLSSTVQRRGNVARISLANPAAVEVRMVPTGFAPYAAVLPVGETEFIFSSQSTPVEMRRTWLMDRGPIEVRLGALNPGQTGTYTVQLAAVSASVENCQAVIVAGSVSSNQQLTATDCDEGGFFHDEFLVYSSRPCVITMTRASMADPFLEAYAGATRVSFDDDGAGASNARLQLPTCRSAADGVLSIRATSFEVGDTGTYSLSVVFGDAAEGAAVEGAPRVTSGMRVKSRADIERVRAAGVHEQTWLERIGVSRIHDRAY